MWIYGQANGAIVSGDARGIIVAAGRGYSGKGACRNVPAAESIRNHGPIPAGLYTIEGCVDSPTKGPVTLQLKPDMRNAMFGRSAFLIHGDNPEHDASEGCIILPRPVREAIWSSNDRVLLVVPFV